MIVSSHLVRRADRQKELLEAADPWDLVILDEAHHARRRGAGSASEGGPNALLRLMLRDEDADAGSGAAHGDADAGASGRSVRSFEPPWPSVGMGRTTLSAVLR